MRAHKSSAVIGGARPVQRLVSRIPHQWVWPLSVALLGVGTLLLWLPYIDAPLDVDVGTYATVAYWWGHGDPLYQHITADRPQGIFVIFRMIEALGLGSVRGIHLLAAVYAACCTLALLLVVTRVWGRAIGSMAAIVFSLIMATPYLQGPTANAELFMLLPLLLSLDTLIRADAYPLGEAIGSGFLFGSGVLGAIALLVKPPGVAIVILGILWLARRWRTEKARGIVWVQSEVALIGGFLLGMLPALIHGLIVAPDRYFYAIFFYRFNALSAAAIPLSVQFSSFASVVLYIVARYPVLLLTLLGVFMLRPDAYRRDLLGLWLSLSLFGASIGGNWFPHYFQQLLPPLSVAVALALRAMVSSVRASRPALRWCWPLLRVVTVFALLYLVATVGYMLLPSSDASRLVIDHSHPTTATRDVAYYLRTHTAPQDMIYVAYGQGDIYYLSQRRPAARWLHTNEIRRIPGAFDEQMILLTDPITSPRYIVAAQNFDYGGLDPNGTLRSLIAHQYVLETTIGGIPLYRRIN